MCGIKINMIKKFREFKSAVKYDKETHGILNNFTLSINDAQISQEFEHFRI
jgi:hypothetical protein